MIGGAGRGTQGGGSDFSRGLIREIISDGTVLYLDRRGSYVNLHT